MGDQITKQDIEQLAAMTQRGFERLEERLSKHEEVLAGITSVLERIELRLSEVAYKVDLVELRKRVERIEEHVGLKNTS